MVLRNSYLLAGDLLKGGNHTIIGRWPSLEEDVFPNLLTGNHLVKVIVDYGIAETGYQVITISTFLLMMDQIRLHEHGTTFPEPHRAGSSESYLPELFLDIYAEFLFILSKLESPCTKASPSKSEIFELSS